MLESGNKDGGKKDYLDGKESVVRAPKKIDGVSISAITKYEMGGGGKKVSLYQAREAAEACSVVKSITR